MFPKKPRVVVDTNVLISHVMFPGSVPDQAVLLAQEKFVILTSDAMLDELKRVLQRPKLLAYINADQFIDYIAAFINMTEPVDITTTIRACRDPQDDKLLSLAVSGGAQWIITGDDDLLVLDPFRGVTIGTPRRFLDRSGV